MAFITGKTVQGNCGAVVCTGNGHYTCGPIPDVPGVDPCAVDHINFYARIEGQVGEEIHLDLQWPVFDSVKCGPRKYELKPFFFVAHRAVFKSCDELNWERIADIQVDEAAWTMHFSLTLTEPVCFVSVNLYYTRKMYAELRRALADSPLVEERIIGKAWDGQDMRLFVVTDPSVPEDQKQIVYLQGAQHCCEFSGPHVLDAMLRYLISGEAKTAQLLKKYAFHIMPVFSVADWSNGYKDERMAADPNTDWKNIQNPENRALDAYLRSLPVKPSIALDFHNARKGFAFVADYVPEAQVAEQMRFVSLLTAGCDYIAPGSVTHKKAEKYENFAKYARENFGFGMTLEMSRFTLYDREKETEVPVSQDGYRRFAKQLPHVIDAFLSGKHI